MARGIVPVAELGTQMPEHGRIRIGVKTERAMKTIDTFRFTSPDSEAITILAGLYGGTAKPWHDERANPQDQFEVITTSNLIHVFVPPNPLSTWYEQWPGPARRCDGITCEVPGHDGMAEVPCICDATKVLGCKPKTRLAVVLPEVPFHGVWRLETSSWNATREMPAMTAMIQQLQTLGFVDAQLTIAKETDTKGDPGGNDPKKKRRRYNVPKLIVDTTPLQMLEGAASVKALSTGGLRMAAIESGPKMVATTLPQEERDWFDEEEPHLHVVGKDDPAGDDDDDDDVVDAELVEDEPSPPPANADRLKRARTKLVIECNEVAGLVDRDGDELRHAVAWWASAKRTETSTELTVDEVSKALDAIATAKENLAGATALLDRYTGRPM